MIKPSSAPANSAADLAAHDLGPLAWALDELRKSLDSANKALKRFVRDAQQAQGSEGVETETSHLRIAGQQLHQSVGVLEMVGFAIAAAMLRGMETAVQRFTEHPALCTEAAAARMERGSFALLGYLEALLKGKSPSALGLFVPYADIQELAGATRIHPADLWQPHWTWRQLADKAAATVQLDASLRMRFDQAALEVIKAQDLQACARLAQWCAGLANQTERTVDSNFRTFWRIAAGAMDAAAAGRLPVDLYFKRTVSSLLIQLASHLRAELAVSERLAQDLLFFCAQAQSNARPDAQAPLLSEVRTVYGLADGAAVDYRKSLYGQFDPNLLAQARKRTDQLKQSWALFAAGDLSKAPLVQDQVRLLVDSMGKLLPHQGQSLASALTQVAQTVAARATSPEATLGMEVATAILYLDASFEEFEPENALQSSRMGHLAQRLQMALGGAASQPLESWIEELYRRVSDRHTMGTVVGELRQTLGELEKHLDAYFRDPKDTLLLSKVPAQLTQIRGVLNVLGLDQATQAVQSMRDQIEHLLLTKEDAGAAVAGTATHFDKLSHKLGHNLSALGFLIDMLSYQPALAKKLFAYDAQEGALKPLMGRRVGKEPAALNTPASALPPSAAAASSGLSGESGTREARTAASEPVVVDAAQVDPELLEIFLAEAQEVIGEGLHATQALVVEPNHIGQMTTLRRAFHTLKGSARMVGLNAFAQAAWSMEQVMNAWLANQKPASTELCQLSAQALQACQGWIEKVAAGTNPQHTAAAFEESADAMRLHGHFKPIAPVVAQQAEHQAQQESAPEDTDTLRHCLDAPELSLPWLDLANQASALSTESPPQPQTDTSPATTPVIAPEAVQDVSLGFDHADTALEPLTLTLPLESTRQAKPPESDAARLPETATQRSPHPGHEEKTSVTAEELAEFDRAIMAISHASAASGKPMPASNAPAAAPAVPAAPLTSVALEPAQVEVNALDWMALPNFSAASPPPDRSVSANTFAAETVIQRLPHAADAATDITTDAAVSESADTAPDAQADAFEAGPAPQELVADSARTQVANAVVDPEPEEPFKVIGSLRVSLPLYNVYLNEADEWSRCLAHALAEWRMEPGAKVPADCVAFAHALAGSSATVGFASLADLARTLENSLLHLQRIEEDRSASSEAAGAAHADDPHQHAQLFVQTAEEIRHLLHQFAAGILKDSPPTLKQALLRCMQTAPSAPSVSSAQHRAVPPTPSSTVSTPTSPAPTSPSPAARSLPTQSPSINLDEINDEIDAQDAVDPDLLDIFQEEAKEIFPAMAAALRQWTARPDNLSARNEVLRGLHTLKGSARLAGAMRLGQWANRMESVIQEIPPEGAQPSAIEALMAPLDAMQQHLETLQPPIAALPPSTTFAAEAQAIQSPADLANATPATATATAATTSASAIKASAGMVPATLRAASSRSVRVGARLLDRLMNQTGEVMITRARMEAEVSQLRGSLTDLTANLDKLRLQLRELDVQTESQLQTRIQQAKEIEASFDPLEFDRYTRVQELTRMMAESVNDVATVQRNIQRTIESTEGGLAAQAHQTRELQRDLLRTRMVEFEGISERLYRVVRQASKDTGKPVKLDILGGSMEMDRGVLDRMTPAFEHLLRNCVAHGIESAAARSAAGKEISGQIVITLAQEGNDVRIELRDDGAGLDIQLIREKAIAQGLLGQDAQLQERDAAELIFTPGFSTATQVTELAGRGVGMDVVRSSVLALGGRIDTASKPGQGTQFSIVLPLTTAVTQVVMVRIGQMIMGIPANLIEAVQRITPKELLQAYNSGRYPYTGQSLSFFWAGALLQYSSASGEPVGKTLPVCILRSAAQRVVVHVDEVLGNQEVVVKNLGPQLSRLPGLAGMTVLPSGATVLIYNPVALASVYGAQALAMSFDPAQPHALELRTQTQRATEIAQAVPQQLTGDTALAQPLILVVDDSITVRRVTQRLLLREGYRVNLATDGLQALAQLSQEQPAVILSDIEMPRMDGFDLLRKLHADDRLKHLPTIMITSRIAEKHRERAFELGAQHYLGKPYSEEELLSLIRRYTGQHIPA